MRGSTEYRRKERAAGERRRSPTIAAACAALLGSLACTQTAPGSGGGQLFVSQAGSSTVAVIDAESGLLQARVEVGLLPHNLVLTADGKTIFAVLVGSQAIAEIDTTTHLVRRTFLTEPVPRTRDDGTVIQPHLDQNAFGHNTCYDCHRPGGALPKYAGDRPFGLLLTPDERQLLVSHLHSSNITVLDRLTGRIERTVHLAPAGEATEAVALARLGNEIWVALRPRQPSFLPGALRRLDAATLAPLGDIDTGSDPGSLLALPVRDRMLVTNFETDTITEHDAAGNARALAAAPGPLGLLALPGGREILSLDYYSNAVTFLDLEAGTSQTLPLARGEAPYVNPTQAALSSDGRSAWIVSSGTDGHLLQFDLMSRRIVRDVPIDGLSFGVAFVPAVPR